MNFNSTIYVAGHRGLVGSALVRILEKQGYHNLLLPERSELDLLDQRRVSEFFQQNRPEYVFLAAAKVGGILANMNYPASFIYDNLMIESNIIHSAYQNATRKLLFLGSSCIYPRMAPQPIEEKCFLTGALEETNKAYAIAKIAGIITCQSYNQQYGTDYISVMPTNLYGPNDNFDLQKSHVLPALLRKFHEAKLNQEATVVVWGTGLARREFLHVDDLASACVYLMKNYSGSEIINIGTGEDISINEAAQAIMKTVGYQGTIAWDDSKPDGTPRKLLDVSKLHTLGWKHRIRFEEGLKRYYEWYLSNS
ncbi:MAG: GDP-L-fucose synthase [bacterium]